MRIIIASQTYVFGNGQASFTIQLAENLVRRGHSVMVITPSEDMKSHRIVSNGVRVEKIPALHLSWIHPKMYATPFPSNKVQQLFDEFRPDLLHIQDHYFLCKAAVQAARERNIPAIGTNHFLPENLLPFLRGHHILQRLFSIPLWKMMLDVFNQLDVATTPSKTAARILREQKIHIPVRAISNGIDVSRFQADPQVDRVGIRRKYGLSPEHSLFLYVGRLDGEKRLDTLLDAVALLEREDYQLAIAGYGLYEQALRKRAKSLGLNGRVVFIGYIPPQELSSLYNSADIFVMPSPEELQSIATLEAMACGKPILAADARALPELVHSGVNGYLFEPGNSRDAAHYMNRLLHESDKWNMMGNASCERAQHHSLQSTLVRYEEQYKAAIEMTRLENRNWEALRRFTRKSI